MAKYGIKVDYFMWSDERGEYTSPCFLYTDRSKFKLLVFDESLDRDDIDLKVFNSEKEANDYMDKHGWNDPSIIPCCYENPRIVKLGYKETGYPDDKQIEKWWDELEDIPFNETMDGKLLLSTNWLNFKAGTEREDIWHWFDAVHSKGVYYLLYEREE